MPNSTYIVVPVSPIQPVNASSRPEFVGNPKNHKTYKSISQSSNSTSEKK